MSEEETTQTDICVYHAWDVCKRNGCPFSHDIPEGFYEGKEDPLRKFKARRARNLAKAQENPEETTTTNEKKKRSKKNKTKTNCRYGKECRRKRCGFNHDFVLEGQEEPEETGHVDIQLNIFVSPWEIGFQEEDIFRGVPAIENPFSQAYQIIDGMLELNEQRHTALESIRRSFEEMDSETDPYEVNFELIRSLYQFDYDTLILQRQLIEFHTGF